jgi:PPP family 3-phenylpropionic acid transporter
MPANSLASPFSSLKRQYFFAYAIMGSLSPFLSVLLKQKGLGDTQIGSAMGISSIAVLLSPVLLSLLADTRFQSRHIMAATFALSSVALACLHFATSFWPILAFLCLQSLAYVAVMPLLDALNFAVQREQSEQRRATVPYQNIRVWGTLGFILPGALIFALLYRGGGMSWILSSGIAFGLLGAVNALRLPATLPSGASELSDATASSNRLPTAQAVRALVRRPVLVFCVSLFLTGLASAGFVAFFPLYLTDVVRVEPHWISPITNLGVVCEIFFMLGLGWFLKNWGLKKLVVAGMLCMALRLLALALFPIPAVAISSQLIHGLIVLATMVVPVMYLNQQAGDTDRNSIQGLYTMAVAGTSRVAGSFLAGYVAKQGLPWVLGYSSALTFAAAALLMIAFHDELAPQTAKA